MTLLWIYVFLYNPQTSTHSIFIFFDVAALSLMAGLCFPVVVSILHLNGISLMRGLGVDQTFPLLVTIGTSTSTFTLASTSTFSRAYLHGAMFYKINQNAPETPLREVPTRQ